MLLVVVVVVGGSRTGNLPFRTPEPYQNQSPTFHVAFVRVLLRAVRVFVLRQLQSGADELHKVEEEHDVAQAMSTC